MQKIASIDIGLKRVGCAVCFDENIVFPQNAIIRKNRNQAAKDIDHFLEINDIDILIVGLPKGGASSEEMERRIKFFVSLLRFNGQIFYQDEYGSSEEAKELLKKFAKQKRDGRIDSLAAKIILERWLEFNKRQ